LATVEILPSKVTSMPLNTLECGMNKSEIKASHLSTTIATQPNTVSKRVDSWFTTLNTTQRVDWLKAPLLMLLAMELNALLSLLNLPQLATTEYCQLTTLHIQLCTHAMISSESARPISHGSLLEPQNSLRKLSKRLQLFLNKRLQTMNSQTSESQVKEMDVNTKSETKIQVTYKRMKVDDFPSQYNIEYSYLLIL